MKIFNYCPSCGSTDIFFDDLRKLRCANCSFNYYHNVAAAVAAILEYEDKVILIRRKREPGRGKLDFPGGFIEPNETAEEALRREIREELGINLGALKYIGSYPNIYDYKKVRYYTCDLFFHCRIDSIPTSVDKTEIAELVIVNPSEVQEKEIAFESTKIGLGLFINTRNST